MVDDLSTEDQIERLKEEARSCTYPTDAATVKKRYKDTALILFKEDLDNGILRNYLTFGTRRSSSVSQYGNTPIVIRRSRSSNGELATVVEQVPTLQGRSTRSNYTLLESAVREKDSDSEDETYFQDSRFDSDESFAIRGNHDDSRLTADSSDSVLKDQETPAASKRDVQLRVCLEERTSTNSEDHAQYHDAEETCNNHHHDTPPQQSTASVESKTTEAHNDDNKVISADSKEATSELLETAINGEKLQTTTDCKGDNTPSQVSEQNFSTLPTQKDDVHPQHTPEGKKTGQAFQKNTSELTPVLSRSIEDKICSPEIDHEAVLREYVQQPSHRGKSLLHDGGKTYHTTSKPKTQQEEFDKGIKPVELKIVESSESVSEQAFPAVSVLDTQKSLTASDIPHLSDDSDVVFIDAGSPSLSRTKLTSDSLSDSNEEAVQGHSAAAGDTSSAPDPPAEFLPLIQTLEPDVEFGKIEIAKEDVATQRRLSSTSTSKDPPSATLQTSEPDAESKKLETSREDIVPRRRHNSTNSFRDLPIRSPTPPRRKPQKSQTPKLREKTRQRHSSLGLTSDEEIQELLTNGTRSASPTKPGDFKFFSISLKKEKSKSASSLGSKRNKERVKLTSVRLSLEDPGAVNPKLVPRQREEGHIDTPGKRVGVRSMMIDGTIKRNFIVIHPSDDSDTIGLAPKSPQTGQKEVSVSTPEALSTVKTRIAAPSKEKLEVTKRISHQGGLKEELSDIPENIRNESRAGFRSSLNFSQISRSLRLKQNKKNWEHSSLRSSHSLSSEPVCPSPSSSQILCKSPSALSRVECDSPNALPQKPDHTQGSNTVSRFCVVM